MRVKDLLAMLSEMDPALDVLAHAQHGECKFTFFDIENVAVARAVRSRDETGLSQAQLDDQAGRPLAVLTLTSDF